jgi:ribonuclease HI
MEPPKETHEHGVWGSVSQSSGKHSPPHGAGNLGHTTNNVAELWGLTTGLQLALKHHFNKLIVEGYSQVILNLFQKILNGADPEQVSPCWCLSHGLRTIATLLHLVKLSSILMLEENPIRLRMI